MKNGLEFEWDIMSYINWHFNFSLPENASMKRIVIVDTNV